MKKWLIIAGCLMAAGLILFTVGLSIAGFDFTRLGTKEMVTNTHKVEDAFTNIRVEAITADITFLPAEDGRTEVICCEDVKMPFRVYVENDLLVISCKDNRKWYDHIGITWAKETVTVYLPTGEYGDLQVDCTTGDVTVTEAFSFKNAEVDVTTGDVHWKADVSNALSVKTTTGHVTLTDVMAQETINVQVSTGDVKLNRVDGGQITIKTTTGDVTGTILSDKVFITEVTTGNVCVPQTTAGGTCHVKTTTGDIDLRLAE